MIRGLGFWMRKRRGRLDGRCSHSLRRFFCFGGGGEFGGV
jgi:hypothetical protein